jgi:hypothetical protein
LLNCIIREILTRELGQVAGRIARSANASIL